jgi:hypothetical protein
VTTTPSPQLPWYAAIDLVASQLAPTAARRWLDGCLSTGPVPARHRREVREVGCEFTREATAHARVGDPLLLEIDIVGPIARLSVTGPARTARLGVRTMEMLRSAFEWGVDHTPGGGRRIWCHVQIAA